MRKARSRAWTSSLSATCRFQDLVRVLPEREAARAYRLVTHADTRGLGRIRAVTEHLAQVVARDRASFP